MRSAPRDYPSHDADETLARFRRRHVRYRAFRVAALLMLAFAAFACLGFAVSIGWLTVELSALIPKETIQ